MSASLKRRCFSAPLALSLFVLSLHVVSLHVVAQNSPVHFEMVHFARNYPCGPRGKATCLSVEVDYPAIVAAPTAAAQSQINATIQQHLFSTADGSPGPTTGEALAVELENGYRDIQRQNPEYHTPWFDHRSAAVLLNTAAVFCVQFRMDRFAGGAHPNSIRLYANLRPSTGELIALDDLLKPGALPQLAALAEKRFRDARKLAPGADLKQAGFTFENDKFALTQNFALTPDSLVFYYNSYDVAPYYFGPTEVKIPYSEIRDLLRPELLPPPAP